MHDGKTFGVQELEEPTYTVKTEFVKRKGGDHGGDWTARITMTPKDPMQVVVVSSMFYVALDGQGRWDEELSREIIGHWLDLMNTEGWIPREQILGPEARAYVPAQFVVGSMASTYRWRGRDSKAVKQLNPQTLTSGLDDYPRASHPTDEERHVDLRCWIALASGVMAEIAKALNKDWEEYAATHKLLTDNALLDHLHWSEKGQQYSDYGLHTDKVKLEKPPPPPNLQPGQRPPQMDKIRVTVSDPKNQFVNAFGYVSLFPFLLKIINPDSPKLYRILTDLRDPGLLWTDYGLRSLARSNRMYNRYNTEHDAPYWRGAIWININYLALGSLHHYAHTTGPYMELAREIYGELRTNIVNNMVNEFERTGYLGELQ
nr:hypothetical protein BaRGS_004441 [Batillaria attramentaria]